jgi:hypothetical protein
MSWPGVGWLKYASLFVWRTQLLPGACTCMHTLCTSAAKDIIPCDNVWAAQQCSLPGQALLQAWAGCQSTLNGNVHAQAMFHV